MSKMKLKISRDRNCMKVFLRLRRISENRLYKKKKKSRFRIVALMMISIEISLNS